MAVKQILHVNEKEMDEFKKECELLKNIRPHPNLVLFLGVTTPPQPIVVVLGTYTICELFFLTYWFQRIL